MSYEKRPDYACAECHKSFKNQRAFDAHNKALHAVVDEVRNRRIDSGVSDRGRDFIRDGDESHSQ